MSLSQVAAGGDRLATLRELRASLASALDGSDSGRDIAALSRQLTDVLAQIAEIEEASPEKEGTALDELERRRAARQANAAGRAAT